MERYLYIDTEKSRRSQDFLKNVMLRYSRLRDYYLGTNKFTWFIEYVIGDLLAQGINSTLITKFHSNYEDGGKGGIYWTKAKFPRFLPKLLILGRPEGTVGYVWEAYYKKVEEIVSFAMLPLFPTNFAYCSYSSRQNSIWQFHLFSGPFQFQTWVVLFISAFLIGLIAFSNVQAGFSPAFISSFASIITTVGGGDGEQRSKLFIMWMLTSMILSTFYSGEMTGKVIKPSPENVWTYLEELERNNYSLVFDLPFVFEMMTSSTRMLLTGKEFYHPKILTLERLLEKAVVLTVPQGKDYSDSALAETLVIKNKLTIVTAWPFAIAAANAGNLFVSSLSLKNKERTKRCYLGRELINTGERFVAFLPPESFKLYNVYQNLQAFGIIQRWYQEYVGISYSKRVQDRVRVKSMVKIDDGWEPTVEVLRLEGKTITIFLLWSFLTFVNTLILFAEIVWYMYQTS